MSKLNDLDASVGLANNTVKSRYVVSADFSKHFVDAIRKAVLAEIATQSRPDGILNRK